MKILLRQLILINYLLYKINILQNSDWSWVTKCCFCDKNLANSVLIETFNLNVV